MASTASNTSSLIDLSAQKLFEEFATKKFHFAALKQQVQAEVEGGEGKDVQSTLRSIKVRWCVIWIGIEIEIEIEIGIGIGIGIDCNHDSTQYQEEFGQLKEKYIAYSIAQDFIEQIVKQPNVVDVATPQLIAQLGLFWM